MTCACAGKVLAVPTPCPVHWPEGIVRLMEAGAAKANAKGSPMLSREQFAEVEKVVHLIVDGSRHDDLISWTRAASVILDAIKRHIVLKVEVSPTATATGTLEGLDGLGRRGRD